MDINVITLFPEIFKALDYGVVGRALHNKLLSLNTWNPRDFTNDTHRTVDDRPYGGGPGMVMLYEPLAKAVTTAQAAKPHKVIYLSPQGTPFTQAKAEMLSAEAGLTLIAGRYEGIDERFIEDYVDEEISVGDYVVSGGEIPALLLIDAITRLLPGALGHELSAVQDSFSTGLLDHPHFTRPEVINNKNVPKVLLSGDHKEIKLWREQEALRRTWQRRPDLLKRRVLSGRESQLLKEFNEEIDHE